MFICRSDDDLNLDEFETENDDINEDIAVDTVDIQNLATNLIGEHECLFDQLPSGIKNESLKLMVTTEANAYSFQTASAEFKAKLIVDYELKSNTYIEDDVYIHCPKSGRDESTGRVFSFYENGWKS